MDSFGGPSASRPRTGGNTKNYRAFGTASDAQPLLRDGVAPTFFNRIGRLQPRDFARSALQLLLLLGVAAISLMAYSSTTMTDAVALSAPLGHTPVSRTFTVHTCGIPPTIKEKYIPSGWPAICRVKLVGCPGGGAAGWRHWRYEEGLEMTATGSARNAFTVSTDIYHEGKGLSFFSNCYDVDEALRA